MDTIWLGELADWVRRRAEGPDRFLFGIAGPPGCGKTTIAAVLGTELGAPVVAMDGFHRPNAELERRGLRGVKGAPETFDAQAFVSLVSSLRDSSGPVSAPGFDRMIDEPVPDGLLVPIADRVVIVEGNYLLLADPPWSDLVDIFDAIAYVDLERDLRVERLIARHVAHGKRIDAATDFVHRSDERNTTRIEAGRERADLILAGR